MSEHVGWTPPWAGMSEEEREAECDWSCLYEKHGDSSWWPQDVTNALYEYERELPPTLLMRSDKQTGLLYPGQLHWVAGEPESGKTWLALLGIGQVVMDQTWVAPDGTEVEDANVFYVDFEDNPSGTVGRLPLIGVDRSLAFERVTYMRPNEPIGEAAVDIAAFLRPRIVVLDGATPAMQLHGLDPDSAVGAALFRRRVCDPFTSLGAAVLVLDHVVKNPKLRGRWAAGSGYKMAAVSGAAYTVESVIPFARGEEGFSRVLLTKDRRGAVRPHATSAGLQAEIGWLLLKSEANGEHADLRLIPPPDMSVAAAGGSGLSDAALMAQIVNKVEWLTDQLQQGLLPRSKMVSKNAVYREVGGKRTRVLDMIDHLLKIGHLVDLTGGSKEPDLRVPADD